MSVDLSAKIREHEQLRQARLPHESVWKECFDSTHPERGTGFYDETETATSAQARRARITDSTGSDAARNCSSMIHSGLTPANSRWFGLVVDNDTDEERRWLDGCAETLWQNIHMSNFDATAFEASQDGVDAGWSVLYLEEAKEGGYHFEQWPIAGCYIAASINGGVIDIIHYRHRLTALQCVNRFGAENVHPKIVRLAKEKPGEFVNMLRIIEPRQTHVVNARLSKNLPFASYDIDLDNKVLCKESGYHEFPCMVPRWYQIPGSVYATGLVSVALPTIKRLNEITRQQMSAGELATAGMWIAEDDGVLNARTVKVGPRKIIMANSVDSMKPLLTGADFNLSIELVDRWRQDVRRILLADQLQPQDGPAMTATEVHARVNLIRQAVGPIFGKQTSEYLSPLIARAFGIAYRAGVFAPPPASLRGRSFSVKYLSPLARAQQLEDVGAIERLTAFAGNLQQVAPEVLDNVDFDGTLRLMSERLGVPADALRSIQDRDKLRAARVRAQQKEQEAAAAQQLAMEAGSNAIKQAAVSR